MRLIVDVDWWNDKKEINLVLIIDFVVIVIFDCVYYRKLLVGCLIN